MCSNKSIGPNNMTEYGFNTSVDVVIPKGYHCSFLQIREEHNDTLYKSE